MSIWSKIIESVSGNVSASTKEVFRDASHYAVIDCEVGKDSRTDFVALIF